MNYGLVSTSRIVRCTFDIRDAKGVKVDYICIRTFLMDMSSTCKLDNTQNHGQATPLIFLTHTSLLHSNVIF